ncbi:MAG: hypothetical protein KDD45_08100, partial [Bdellovibrionales bacterium]|nr:hypothetical protein [Bdellovibrionales bacterium]
MGITSRTSDFFKDKLSSRSSIWIDGLVIDKVRIGHTRNDLSEEGKWFLFKLLWVSNITKGDT